MLFLISAILYYLFAVIQMIQDIILQSNRNVLMQTVYNILNSISVPIFFLLFRSLRIIFIAWIFSFGVALLYERKLIWKILTNLRFNFKVNYDIFLYGFPLYILGIFDVSSRQLSTFILFELFSVGSLSSYNWSLRIATTVFELFTVLLTGAFPLLTNYYVRNDFSKFNDTIKSILKIGMAFGLFLFGISFIGGNYGIILLVSNRFPDSPLFFRILVFSYFLRTVPLILGQVFNARGNRRFIFEITLIIDSIIIH